MGGTPQELEEWISENENSLEKHHKLIGEILGSATTENMTEALRIAKLSYREICKEMKISKGYLSGVLNNHHTLTFTFLERFLVAIKKLYLQGKRNET